MYDPSNVRSTTPPEATQKRQERRNDQKGIDVRTFNLPWRRLPLRGRLVGAEKNYQYEVVSDERIVDSCSKVSKEKRVVGYVESNAGSPAWKRENVKLSLMDKGALL